MRPVLPALVLSILALATPAQAALPARLLDTPLACYSDENGTFTHQAYLRIDLAANANPAGYRYDPSFPENKTAGDWASTDAGVTFVDGPLAGANAAEAPAGTTMPGDPVEGRTWPLLLDGAGKGTWYCRSTRANPRALFRGEAPWVRQRTGVPVRLPYLFDQGSLSFDLDGNPYSSVQTRVRVARKGLWRLELLSGPCDSADCGSLAIFSAKRAPYRELLTLPKIRLAEGVRGRVGSVGCGPHPGPRNWGPVFCGRNVIVWHQGAINYAIEAVGTDDDGLVDLANQTIISG
jgi:hypothetical protein